MIMTDRRAAPPAVETGMAAQRDLVPTNNPSFVGELHQLTTDLLCDSLGEGRLRELRAQGEAMDDDAIVTYALDAIAKFRSTMSS